MREIDLLIVGAGPAGLSTALHLLQREASWGERMLVLEKAAHPRHKLCAGGVTRLGLRVLRDLGVPLPPPIPCVPVEDARLKFGERVIHVRGRPVFLVFQRMAFDAYLAQLARQRGVILRENEKVHSLQVEEQGVRVESGREVYFARTVVGADGSKGVVRRYVRAQVNRRSRSPSRVARLLEVVTPAPEGAAHFQQRFALFDFSPSSQHLQGYVWDFPSHMGEVPHFNRGIYDARIATHNPKASLPTLLDAAFQTKGSTYQPPKVEGHPLHWFTPRNRLAVPRILLVGDAAGADPLFGEGIAPALVYGKTAAAAIQRAFQRGDFTYRDYPRRVMFSVLGRYLGLRWAAAWVGYHLSHRPRAMRALWRIARPLAAVYNALM